MPPPLQNNVVDEEEVDDEGIFEDTNQDMNHFWEGLSGSFVTEEEFLNEECFDADMFETEDDLGSKMTAVTVMSVKMNSRRLWIWGQVQNR